MRYVLLALGVIFVAAGGSDKATASKIRVSLPKLHVRVSPGLVSPNGERVAFVKEVPRTYGMSGDLAVSTKGNAPKVVYYSSDACCTNLVWASSRVLVFDDDYNVKTFDVTTHHVNRIAGFSNFAVSKNGELVVGWADSGGHEPETVGVVSITGADCRLVPRQPNIDDSEARFSADGRRIIFLQQTFSLSVGFDTDAGSWHSVSLNDLRSPPKTDAAAW